MRIQDVLIRNATVTDAPLIAQVGASTFAFGFPTVPYKARERLSARIFNAAVQAEELQKEGNKTLVAQLHDDIIGMVRLHLHDDGTFEILRLNVMSAFQGRGVGRKLMEQVDAWTGSGPLRVRIPEGLPRAVAFFEKYDFRIESQERAGRKRLEHLLVRDRAMRLRPVVDETPRLRPRIFISYSVKDAQGVKVRKSVTAKLLANGFDVWVDSERVKLGEQFPKQIFAEIFQCHGGVIIFSGSAAESQWVQAEATVLAARSWRDGEKFPLVLIFVPPEKPEQLLRRKPFEALDLASMHAITDPDSDKELDHMVERFSRLKHSHQETPIDALIDVVVRRLPRDQPVLARAVYASLDEAALQEPGMDVALADPDQSAPLLARSFFHIGLHAFRDALRHLAAAMTKSDAAAVVDIVVPFWIDPKAVAPLARAAFGHGRSVPLVNARNDMTVRMYIKRAAAEYPFHWVVIPVTGAGGEKTASAIISEIRDNFRSTDPGLAGFSKAEIDEQIEIAARLDPVIVVIPPTVRVEAIKKVRTKYPHCTFFIRSGPKVPPRERYVGLDVVVLQPELTPDIEAEVHALYLACNRIAESIV